MHRSILIFSLIFYFNISSFCQKEDLNKIANELYSGAFEMLNENPDSSLKLVTTAQKAFVSINDTSGLLKCMHLNADLLKNKSQYYQSFDILWEALYLAEQFKDTSLLIKVNNELGLMYSIFNQPKESNELYEKSIELCKQSKDYRNLSSTYYSYGLRKRDHNKLEVAMQYLDSCEMIRKQASASRNNYFLMVERGSVLLKMGRIKEAEKLLLKAYNHFENNDNNFLAIINKYLGDLSLAKNEPTKAIQYYLKALSKIEKFKTHNDHRIYILENLSLAYIQTNQAKLAYKYLKAGKAEADSLFNIKNSASGKLFQLKNGYNEKIRVQNEALKTQNTMLEKEKQSNTKLQFSLLIVILLAFILILIIKSSYQKKKHAHQKEQGELKAAVERERADAIKEFKDKEITSYTLQLIDKETHINTLIDFIKDKVKDSAEKRTLLKQVKTEDDLWEEFNKRFVEVHNEFYDNLTAQFPKLSPTELKHCALIKLNFSSKEMSRLLNISLNSTHISRHRIRKKLGLSREDNLEHFIAGI